MTKLLCRELLKERSQEILSYFRFLQSVINDNAVLQIPKLHAPRPIAKNLTHTLKANGYLLIYNVVEATMTTAVKDIHLAIRQDFLTPTIGIHLDELNAGLFKLVLGWFQRGNDQLPSRATRLVSSWMVQHWLDEHDKLVSDNKNPLFSGNLDAREMLKIAKTYGFNAYGDEPRMKHRGLFLAKSKRNSLAHGEISFLDCGRDIALEDLVQDGIGVIRCLRHYIRAVDIFISQRGYVYQALQPIPIADQQLQPV